MKYILYPLAFFVVSGAVAQNSEVSDTAYIPEVRIRATLIADSLQSVPASVGVLSKAELNANNGAIITPALNTVPGIYMQQGALNTNRITIRGIGARTQYGTDRVKAYIDGIPVSSAAGSTVIEDIDTDILERVEVVKGPASGMFGAGLGGTIFLYTKDLNRNAAQFQSTVGSFGYFKNSLDFSAAGKKAGVEIHYAQVNSDGYRDNSTYARKSLSLSGRLDLSEATTLRLFTNPVRLKAHIPSSLNATDFENNPETAASNWAAAKGYESYDKLLSGLTLEHHFSSRFQNVTTLFAQYRDGYEPRPFDILDENQLGLGARTKFNLRFPLFTKPSELAFGAEYLREDYEVTLHENLYRDFPGNGSVQGRPFNGNKQRRAYLNLFLAWQWSVSDRLSLDIGLNVNTTRYELKDSFTGDSLDQTGAYRYPVIASPRLAAHYEWSPGKNLYANLSHGFSTPGVEETLTPDGEINTDLLPETGWNLELGLKSDWLDRKLYAEAAIYTIFIDNLLVAQRVAEDQYMGINAGKTQHTGLEILLNYKMRMGKNWLLKPYFNTTVNHFKFKEFEEAGRDYSGNKLTGVPRNTLNLGLSAKAVNGLYFGIRFLHVGEIPLNDANTAYSDAYGLLNFNARYTFRIYKYFTVDIYAGINNLTNEAYAASVLPNAVGFGDTQPRYYYPGDPRNFYAGIRLSWEYK